MKKLELDPLQEACENFYHGHLRPKASCVSTPAVGARRLREELDELVEALESGSLAEVESELADVLISLGCLVAAWPIDWLGAVRDKNSVNDARTWFADPKRPGCVTRKK